MIKITSFIGAASLLALSSGLVQAGVPNHGLLALLEVEDTASYDSKIADFEKQAQALDCTLLREGPIMAEDGDIDLDQPNRFVYLNCTAPLLGDVKGRDLILELGKGSEYIAAMEGVSFFHDAASFAEEAGARSYILKVSNYNNTNPNERDNDLAVLGETVAPRPDAYQLESYVGITRAYGMPTPDEAVVLYYDSAVAGDRFRDNNPDVLGKVVDFNEKHLTDYIYYFAQSRR